MATIVTRTAKGSALTFAEVDGNFTNLNADGIANTSSISNLQNDKLDKSGGTMTGSLVLNSNLTTNAKVITNSAANSQSGSLVTLTTPGTEIVRLTNVLLTSLAGIQAGTAGQKLILSNRSGTTVTVENESSSASTSADQICTGTGAAISIQNNASISLIYDGNLSKWNVIGGTGSGTGSAGINYIANPDASIGTTGYTPYNDGTAVPVDGSGGTPSSGLWVRSTVSPLRGSGDFNLVKTGSVSYLGQGVAYDFTIDNADLAKVLTVTFDYEVVSGTYATGDATVYIIQDPAGTPVVIQPAGYQIQAATIGTKMRQIATFQTASNVTSYRLCIHIASASTSDYTLALDTISVGPQVVQYGAPVTDWQSYTPTFTGFGTVATQTFWWRRVGDSVEIKGRFVSGISTATEARVSLPSITSAGSDRIATIEIAGVAEINTIGGVGQNVGVSLAVLAEQSVGYVTFSARSSANTGLTKLQGTGIIASGSAMTLEAKLPITGWSSTVQMSNDTDTRVVAAKAAKTAAQSIPNNSLTKVTLSSSIFDTHSGFDFVNSRYVIQVPGIYRVSALVAWGNTPAGARSLRVYKNGSVDSELYNTIASSATGIRLNGSVTVSCVAGDYLEIYAFQDSGGALNIDGTIGSAFNYFSVERLSGPSAIAASETVAARYESTAGATFTVAGQTINFDSKSFDTHGAVTTGASWVFTAPISGKYRVSSGVGGLYNTGAGGLAVFTEIVKGTSTSLARGYGGALNGTTYSSCIVSDTVQLTAGETLKIVASRDGGASNTTSQGGRICYVAIERIGN